MKQFCALFLIVIFFVAGCSKTSQNNIEQKSELKFFHSDQYPMRIDFIEGVKMRVEVNEFKGQHWTVSTDLSGEFPEEEFEPGFGHHLFVIEFSSYARFLSQDMLSKPQEVMLSNIPALLYRESPSGDVGYVLLTPGIYADIGTLGLSGYDDGKHQAYDNRRKQLTLQMLERIYWEEPVDTNSQEFKDWKKHILTLIEESKNKKVHEKD